MPTATKVALTREQCAGQAASTDWCRARQKYIDDRAKHSADLAAWQKKKAEIERQNAAIDRENAANAEKVARQRKEAAIENARLEAKDKVDCKAMGLKYPCRQRQPVRVSDIPAKVHNVVPPPPGEPAAPTALTKAPTEIASKFNQPKVEQASATPPATVPTSNSNANSPGGGGTNRPPFDFGPAQPDRRDQAGNRPEIAERVDDRGRGAAAGGQSRNNRETSSTPSASPQVPARSPATTPPAATGAPGAYRPAVATAPASPANPNLTKPAAPTRWLHNDSEMQVEAGASAQNTLRILYDRPRNGLESLGIRTGTMLFDGQRNGNAVSGQATTFSRKCGPLQYAVSGRVINDNRVVLQGEKPARNSDCAVIGNSLETLEFSLINR